MWINSSPIAIESIWSGSTTILNGTWGSCWRAWLRGVKYRFAISMPVCPWKFDGTQRYESKFILDSFIFCVSPARFLRWLAAIVDFFPRFNFEFTQVETMILWHIFLFILDASGWVEKIYIIALRICLHFVNPGSIGCTISFVSSDHWCRSRSRGFLIF